MPKNISILGAGKSSITLIKYLSDLSKQLDIQVKVIALDVEYFEVNVFKNVIPIKLDINEENKLVGCIKDSFIVVSMLPAFLHFKIAKICCKFSKNLITASYLTPEIKSLETEFFKKNAFLMMEMGLDPGIDHMSAMRIIDRLRKKYEIKSFESYTGGLLAPNNFYNPWQYKFTWNTSNVVLGGKDGAVYLKDKKEITIPYKSIFKKIELINIPGLGKFEGYANRDSLKYLEIYDIKNVDTLLRGTLRNKGFCSSWDIIVELGLTDPNDYIKNASEMTHKSFIKSKLNHLKGENVKALVSSYFKVDSNSEEMNNLEWLGLFSNEPIGVKSGTYAEVLEHILKKKWTIANNEKDRVIMFHRLKFSKNGIEKILESFLVIEGENHIDTAMAKSVGLPIGILIKEILLNKITLRGINLPTSKNIYNPILKELEDHNIIFNETVY